MTVDFGRTASDYAQFRAGFPESFFDRMGMLGIGRAGQQVIDLGTGTGTLARGFARRGATVTGIDPAAPLLEQAKQMDAHAGVQVTYQIGWAEKTGLPDQSADVVTAGQSWHWFDGNAAAREVHRLLKPGGYVVIAHFDWIPLKGNLVEATENLIMKHNPDWKKYSGTSGLYPIWLRHLGENGFDGLETFSYDVFVPYTPEGWRGRIRASTGVGASLATEQVEAFDRDLAALLNKHFPQPMLHVHHRIWAVVAVR